MTTLRCCDVDAVDGLGVGEDVEDRDGEEPDL